MPAPLWHTDLSQRHAFGTSSRLMGPKLLVELPGNQEQHSSVAWRTTQDHCDQLYTGLQLAAVPPAPLQSLSLSHLPTQLI